MQEIQVADKQLYLNENYPFTDIPLLTEKKRCLHCGEEIIVGDYKVFKDDNGNDLIFCPNAPECDGTIIDWMPIE